MPKPARLPAVDPRQGGHEQLGERFRLRAVLRRRERVGRRDGASARPPRPKYNLEDCSGCGVSGWGWQDNGYGTGVLGPLIYFSDDGPQTIRMQTREDGLSIDQIVLSHTTS